MAFVYRKQEARPTKSGWYYGRHIGKEEIFPIYVTIDGAVFSVDTARNEDLNPPVPARYAFEWFGEVDSCADWEKL